MKTFQVEIYNSVTMDRSNPLLVCGHSHKTELAANKCKIQLWKDQGRRCAPGQTMPEVVKK